MRLLELVFGVTLVVTAVFFVAYWLRADPHDRRLGWLAIAAMAIVLAAIFWGQHLLAAVSWVVI